MNKGQLLLAWRTLRGLGASRTVYALLGLYALCCGLGWMVAHGFIQPDGTIDLSFRVNRLIFEIQPFNVWHWAPAVAALPLGFGVYARTVAAGPLLPIIRAASPGAAAVLQAIAACPEKTPDRPDPVVLHTAGLSAPGAAGLGAAAVKPVGADA